MRRSELEKLTTVSVRSRLYVAVDEVLELLKAKETEAKADAEPDAPAVPRKVAAKDKPE